ncbi:MAG: transporter [Candidatus Eremiobacteraeota bacterium]|nr:transporter [Candidatus Eremiobacteraeota bacterium]
MKAERRAFGLRDHAALNALWLGIQFQDSAILAIVVPSILLRLAPQSHTGILAAIATVVATAWVFVPPLAGALSDRARRRGGDRRREVAITLGLDIAALVALAYAHSIGALAVEVVCAAVAIATASTIYQAMLPEVVPREAWGASAGVRGAMTLIGTVGGLAAGALLPAHIALLMMAAAVALVLPSLAVIPRESPTEDRTEHAVVRDRHDLNVTVVARGWIVLGMTLLNTYVLYFFSDILGVRDASLGTGMVAGAALLGAIASSVAAGLLSDKFDRRAVVALSGVPMVLAALGFAIAPDQRFIFVYAALFGLGYGGVFSVGWALALDAIPALGDAARDLGVWATLSNLPGVAAPALGAFIIAHGATPRDGYRTLFATAAAAFALGSLTVLRVGVRPVSSTGSLLLLVIVTAIRQPWLTARFRVRQWGRLPFRRGPTLLIANHQHEDESEIVALRSFAQGSWRSSTLTASSRRMYEPGFFASRLPAFAFMRTVNAGPLFIALGMYPLENELSSRPLRSIAFSVRQRHGDLDLAAILRSDAMAAVPPGATRTSDLLAPRFFAASDVRVKLSHVLEPYRRELLTELRTQIDADIARIADLVRRGATFYVTPEGFYSTDGRMRPLKGIVEHLTPIADVWFAAIAFDPFRGRRLSMLYRVVRPADPKDLGTSLAAARPVTTSALLATWLTAVDLPFDADEARDGVTRARDALPRAAFVDPELARDAARVVDDALARLVRRGTLMREGNRYALAPNRHDPRFPDVTDMVAYQTTFHAETLAALQSLLSP